MCHQKYDTYLYHPPHQGDHRLYSTFAISGPQLTALLYLGSPPPVPQPYNTVDITHNWMKQWHTVTFHYYGLHIQHNYHFLSPSQMNPFHTQIVYFSKIQFNTVIPSNIILLNYLFLELSSPKLDMYFLTLHACYMSHSSWFNHLKHTNYILCNFSSSCYLLQGQLLSLLHFIFKYSQPPFSTKGKGSTFISIKMCKIIALYLFNW